MGADDLSCRRAVRQTYAYVFRHKKEASDKYQIKVCCGLPLNSVSRLLLNIIGAYSNRLFGGEFGVVSGATERSRMVWLCQGCLRP
jgi:hypothetical protein